VNLTLVFKEFAVSLKGKSLVIKGFQAIAALSLGSGATVNKKTKFIQNQLVLTSPIFSEELKKSLTK